MTFLTTYLLLYFCNTVLLKIGIIKIKHPSLYIHTYILYIFTLTHTPTLSKKTKKKISLEGSKLINKRDYTLLLPISLPLSDGRYVQSLIKLI